MGILEFPLTFCPSEQPGACQRNLLDVGSGFGVGVSEDWWLTASPVVFLFVES